VQLVCLVAGLVVGCAIATGYILNALFPVPTAEAPEVVAWIAANATSITADSARVAKWMAASSHRIP